MAKTAGAKEQEETVPRSKFVKRAASQLHLTTATIHDDDLRQQFTTKITTTNYYNISVTADPDVA